MTCCCVLALNTFRLVFSQKFTFCEDITSLLTNLAATARPLSIALIKHHAGERWRGGTKLGDRASYDRAPAVAWLQCQYNIKCGLDLWPARQHQFANSETLLCMYELERLYIACMSYQLGELSP